MKHKLIYFFYLMIYYIGIVFSNDCYSQPVVSKLKSIHFIGSFILPYNLKHGETTVGGLSGIDYDAKNDLYYIISDDRSAINPARFYTAKIQLGEKKIDTVILTGVNFFKQPNGNSYPNSKSDPKNTPDPEDIRYNPRTNELVWASEGERIVNKKDTVLEDPDITIVDKEGKYVGNYTLPENLHVHAIEKGPRQNSTLEGCSFANDYQTLYVNMEEALYEDGPKASSENVPCFARIYSFDVASKKNTAQYAYPLDTLAYPAKPKGSFAINGMAAILAISDKKWLTVERSYSTGRLACTIKVFLADAKKATDISSIKSLTEHKDIIPVTKKLLINMDSLGMYVDNIEGVTFGPMLKNGKRSLIFVSDNNFQFFQQTQFLLFEIDENKQ